jgi:flagellar operon protein
LKVEKSFFYPNVTSIPGKEGTAAIGSERALKENDGEFGKVFKETLSQVLPSKDLQHIREPLKFSAHATQRIQSRQIELGPELMEKVNRAVDSAAIKGIEDTLILTDDAAFIVSVKNRTVVTAMGRDQVSGNVFSNIDGAVVV